MTDADDAALHWRYGTAYKIGDIFTMEGLVGGSWWDRLKYRLGWGPKPPFKQFRVTEVTDCLTVYEAAATGEPEDPPAISG